jgi:hypothetical protein
LTDLLERLVPPPEKDPEIFVVEASLTQAIYTHGRNREIRQPPFWVASSAWPASSFDWANLVPQSLLECA